MASKIKYNACNRIRKTANCLKVIRLQKLCSSGEMMWPSASGEELTNVSALHEGQLIASSALSNPQFTHFFITLEAAVEVGRPVTRPPPHGSRRAVFPHRALQNCSLPHWSSGTGFLRYCPP